MNPAVLSSLSSKDLVAMLYKDDLNRPLVLTPTQEIIFDCIFKRQAPDGRRRIHIETFTQFGKSETVSVAVLTAIITHGGKWVVAAPSQAKARIITGKVIKHAFENEYTLSMMKLEEGESLDRLRHERSKNRLTFTLLDGSIAELFIATTESRLKGDDVGNSMMGFGANNLIMDEAALIDDGADAKAMRMVGGFTAAEEDFVVKIGNPFKRNHFLKSFQDPKYYKIKMDWRQGVAEGRLTSEFVEEMRAKPFFSVLYECQFPKADDVDARGWTQLLSETDIENAMVDEAPAHVGEKRLGTDVARGGNNFTTQVLRSMNYMELLEKSLSDNLTETAGRTAMLAKDNGVIPENIFIDEIGVGGGVVDPLRAQMLPVKGVNVGKAAQDDTRFFNLRAEAYWRLKEWIKKGGKLNKCDDWYQLTYIKYKPDSRGRIKIMSKDEMRALGIDSPDVADGGMLCFVRGEHAQIAEHREKRAAKKRKRAGNRSGSKLSMGGY